MDEIQEKYNLTLPNPDLYGNMNREIKGMINDYYANHNLQMWANNYRNYQELENIKSQIEEAKRKININSQKIAQPATQNNSIKAIKNQNNSEILNTKLIELTNPNESFYMVFANSGCVSYENNMPLGIKRCDAADKTQRFSINHIKDESLKFNHWIVNPKSNKDQCMTFSDSGLSVVPCDDTNIRQRFAPLYNHVI